MQDVIDVYWCACSSLEISCDLFVPPAINVTAYNNSVCKSIAIVPDGRSHGDLSFLNLFKGREGVQTVQQQIQSLSKKDGWG